MFDTVSLILKKYTLAKREGPVQTVQISLRKHAYSNILKILYQENFQIKNSEIFHFPAQKLACGYS